MKIRDYIFRCTTPIGLTQVTSDATGTLFRKEVAYPGRFVKKTPTGAIEFELPVDEALIDQWVATFNKMKQNGVEVPVPIGHTSNPEARRGTVERMSKEDNGRGQNALFAYIRFASPAVAMQLKNSQVSLYMPPEVQDGIGNKYIRPIQHVAITDYPVVPGLGKFQAIAAAYDLTADTDTENGSMTLAELAAALGVEVPEGASDDEIGQAIIAAKGDDAGGDGLPEGDELPDMGGEGEGGEGLPDMGGGEDEELDDEGNPKNPAPLGFSLAPTIIKQVIRSRRLELDQLVKDRRIAKPVADKLAAKYLTPNHMTYALSMEQQGAPGDDFDSIVAALSLNPPMYKVGEHTGPQVRRDGKSPLVVDAENRAASRKR